MIAAVIHALSLALAAQLSPEPVAQSVHQHGSSWTLSYAFSLPADAPGPVVIAPSDLSLKLTSPGLSNSRAGVPGTPAAHSIPRPVSHAIDGSARTSLATYLDNGKDDGTRCRERAVLSIWSDEPEVVTAAYGRIPPEVGPPLPTVALAGPAGPAISDPVTAPPAIPVTVRPGGRLNVRIALHHDHEGNHGLDPLLGRRDLSLSIGPNGATLLAYRDSIDLSREHYFHRPDPGYDPMRDLPPDKLDTLVYWSSPSSLVLDAAEPGGQYFRLPERKVRGGVRMRLRFRYLVSPDCEGEAKVRVSQYSETPNQWRVLGPGGFERELSRGAKGKAGQWTTFTEVFTTQPEANVVAVDFRIANAEWGLVWLDDVAVEYMGGSGRTGTDTP